MTGWAVLGLESAGVNPLDGALRLQRRPIDYLRSTVGEITTTGDIERTILVLEAAGLNSRAFAGKDLVQRLQRRRGGDGSWGRQVNPTAFGVMALDAASVTAANRRSAAWLAAQPERRRRLGLLPGRPERVRQHRGRPAGAGGGGRQPGRDQQGRRLPAPDAARRRRLRARRWRRPQLPVDRLGRPGPGRRRSPRRARCAAGAARRSTTWPRSRPATATTATRAPPTRPRSGSPARASRRRACRRSR